VAERERKEEWRQAQLSSPSGQFQFRNMFHWWIGAWGNEWNAMEGHHNLPAHSTHKMCWPTAGENCRNKFPQAAAGMGQKIALRQPMAKWNEKREGK